MGQGQRLRGASEELLELEVEAEIAMIHGQTPDRGLGEGPSRSGQVAVERGGPLRRERRIAGQQLVRAVATESHLHLARAKRLSRCVGKIDASPNGSSSQAATSGRSSYTWATAKVRSWWSVPR